MLGLFTKVVYVVCSEVEFFIDGFLDGKNDGTVEGKKYFSW